MLKEKCRSCEKGYNGTNGNGYMPCGCVKKNSLEKSRPPRKP